MRGRVPVFRRGRSVLAVVAAGVLLAGCGGGGSGDEEDSDSASAEESPSASAEPGKADGTWAGDFHNVPNPPEGTAVVTGTAEMVVDDDGTKVTVDVEGLEEKASYVAFVYNDACAADEPGGEHYMFDPESTAESNMIHLPIEIKDGKGTAEVKSDEPATTAARSVIIHLVRTPEAKKDEKTPPKIACADFVKR